MNMPMGNPFDVTSGDQSIGARRPYLLDGDYKLEIERCTVKGRNDPDYLIEVKVLESNVPDRPTGFQAVIFIDMSNRDMFGKHVCALIASVFGTDPMTLPKNSQTPPWDPQQPWSGYIGWSVSEQNPFAKKQIFCNVTSVWTQKNTPFTLHTFSPIGLKQISAVRQVGPAFEASQQRQQGMQAAAGAPAGAAPGGFVMPGAPAGANPFGGGAPGFAAPMAQPGMPPQGFGAPGMAPMPPAGMPMGQPAPLGGFQPPAGAPAPQGAPPAGWGAQPSMPAPQPGMPQGGYPQQPQGVPVQGYPQQPQMPQGGYPMQQPQGVPMQGYPQQPQQPGFGGQWGGGQR